MFARRMHPFRCENMWQSIQDHAIEGKMRAFRQALRGAFRRRERMVWTG